jgi:nitrite reductase (NADH) small subunit
MSAPATGAASAAGAAGAAGAPGAAVVVCALEDIEVEGGVTALVAGRAVAIFRTAAGTVHALDNYDPFSHASVLARGIVGTIGSRDVVVSPMHKQRFDLRTGRGLEDDTVAVAVHEVRVEQGMVSVAVRDREGSGR